MKRWTGVLIFLLGVVSPLAAQTDGEPKLDDLREHFQKDYLSVGILFQTVADFQADRTFAGNNGFSVANMRVKLFGELDHGFGYFLQANFISSPAMLDANMSYRFSPRMTLVGGLSKSPFSAEFLTGADAIDFVNRSQVVSALAPGRQIGVQLKTQPADRFTFDIGLFNGNGFAPNGNDDDSFLAAARIQHQTDPDAPANLTLGLNIAFSDDSNVSLLGLPGGFSGTRVLEGGDVRFTLDRWLISSEVIAGQLDPDGPGDFKAWGAHSTIGYTLTEKIQGLFRLDWFESDDLGIDSQLLVFGLNWWPTGATELQFNYIVDADDAALDHHQLLINAQVAF